MGSATILRWLCEIALPSGGGMNAGHQSSIFGVIVVALQKLASCFLIQCRLWIGHNQETLYDLQVEKKKLMRTTIPRKHLKPRGHTSSSLVTRTKRICRSPRSFFQSFFRV